MTDIFVILPNHLFENISTLIDKTVYLIEEPLFFYDNKYRKYEINKIKLAFMRASMKFYFDYLEKNNIKIKYISYNEIKNYEFLKNVHFTMYNPYDRILLKKYTDIKLNYTLIEDTEQFLSNTTWNKEFFQKKHHNKNISNSEFYKFLKNKLNILKNINSYDKDNRNNLPQNYILEYDFIKKYNNYYSEAINYINTHETFKNNLGYIENVKIYPITFIDCKNNFHKFLEYKLNKYGDYQDAIDKDKIIIYHSNISSALNNGLLTPKYILNETLKYYEKNKNKIKINNLEGFIRQILGWREFCQFIYSNFYNELHNSNYWNNTRKLKWEYWHHKNNKILNIFILDSEIDKCIKYAYSHHIVRLMIFLNIFNLCEVSPYEIKKWFMEICSIDAWDWVMDSNIWIMGYFTDKFMKKPYISTENYIIKMSNYRKKPCEIWKSLYYNFLFKNKNKLVKSASVLLRNLYFYNRLSDNDKSSIHNIANIFINKYTI